MRTSQVLEKALELLGPNGEHWCTGDDYVWPENGECASTACGNADSGNGWAGRQARKYLAKAFGLYALEDYGQIHDWNDAPERTWPEVKAAFEKAISLAKQEEVGGR